MSAEPAVFGVTYYERGLRHGVSCYTDYRWLPDLTIPMAKAVASHLGLTEKDSILELGCAKGFLVRALRELGYDAHGVDISEYAIGAADEATKPFLSLIKPTGFLPLNDGAPWDWIIAKDVFEHIPDGDLAGQLHERLSICSFIAKKVFIVVPLGAGGQYVIPDMERDQTHLIRRPLDWWSKELNDAGFKDVRASYSMPGIKDNWVKKYPQGNGFFIAE